MHPHLSGQLAADRVKGLRDEADHYRLAKRHRLAARPARFRVTWLQHALGSVLSPLHRFTGPWASLVRSGQEKPTHRKNAGALRPDSYIYLKTHLTDSVSVDEGHFLGCRRLSSEPKKP